MQFRITKSEMAYITEEFHAVKEMVVHVGVDIIPTAQDSLLWSRARLTDMVNQRGSTFYSSLGLKDCCNLTVKAMRQMDIRNDLEP